MNSDSPILVLDSGLGGLAVAAALRRRLPHEDLIFFGDTARLPYGDKPPAVILDCVRQIVSHFRVVEPKHVVLACNTATAVALPMLRREFPERSISGVIAPCVRATARAAGNRPEPRIGVIGTQATIASRAYETALFRHRHMSRVYSLATPTLVPLIEAGLGDDPQMEHALRQILAPLHERFIDVLALGCTHYHLIASAIAAAAGSGVRVIDSSQTCVEDVVRRLRAADALRDARIKPARFDCFVSGDPAPFSALASRWIGFDVPAAQHFPLDPLRATPWSLPRAA